MNVISRLGAFLHSVREEMRKVSWPTREEVLGSALVVFVGVTLLGSYIGVLDVVLSKVLHVFLR